MPHIVIDGKRVETKNGKTIIEAAYENDINITHFCWHPELSVAGNCRMCLVEIGLPKKLQDGSFEVDSNGDMIISYFPKLQIACATQISDGMHVKSISDKAVTAQEAVMEFLLINHPLDCPICDEAGQCKLQEYAFVHSKGESRFEEEKNHKPKRVEWGPNVVFDGERCISCSRCIRFAQEVAHQDVLTFVQRGDHVTIKVDENQAFDNQYSMNVIDICPVGALTSTDFRFKARVWDMSFNDSICPGCSRGCNTKIGVRNNEILRIEPKTNLYVNKYWMCDYGRLSQYEQVNDNRISSPMIKKDKVLTDVKWNELYDFVSTGLKKFKPNEIMFVASPKSSNEDLYLLSQFVRTILKNANSDSPKHEDVNFKDDFLKTNDISPNSNGIKLFGLESSKSSLINIENLANQIHIGHIKALYLMDNDLKNINNLFVELPNLELFVVHASNHSFITNLADAVIATSTFAESEGTFINIDRRVQHFEPALATKENLRTMGMKLSRLDKFGSSNDRWTHHELRGCRPSWMSIMNIANNFSAGWHYKSVHDVFQEICERIPDFKGMNYSLLNIHQGIILGRGENPDPIINNYESHFYKPN